jgi:DNA (cytosine-5)-methyltransferase 1
MKKINHLDLFSGIGGFHLGFERAGFKIKSYFSEIDKHAIAVYKHKFKDATYVGSVTDVYGGDLPQIDLITFGSPCQDFSLAGKRAGMGGDRSSLILEAIRLVRECRPRVFIWENVKGAFSSNSGEDFAAILQEFADIGGYRLEWQLLNTSWFLPQNRERIYLVGYSTTPKRGWGGVFPIATNNRQADELSRQCVPVNTILQRYTATANGTYIGERELPAQIKPNYASKSLNETIENSNLIEGEPQALDFYNRVARDESPTLTEPHHNSLRMFDGYRIRRLTPIECERLQGFPDQHTAFGNYDGETKPMSNTQRYKQCGNAVTVNVVEAVAKRCIPLFKTNLK